MIIIMNMKCEFLISSHNIIVISKSSQCFDLAAEHRANEFPLYCSITTHTQTHHIVLRQM